MNRKQLGYMRGQALFNRALAYWHAQLFFEIDPDGWGFPIFDVVATDLEGMKRATGYGYRYMEFVIN